MDAFTVLSGNPSPSKSPRRPPSNVSRSVDPTAVDATPTEVVEPRSDSTSLVVADEDHDEEQAVVTVDAAPCTDEAHESLSGPVGEVCEVFRSPEESLLEDDDAGSMVGPSPRAIREGADHPTSLEDEDGVAMAADPSPGVGKRPALSDPTVGDVAQSAPCLPPAASCASHKLDVGEPTSPALSAGGADSSPAQSAESAAKVASDPTVHGGEQIARASDEAGVLSKPALEATCFDQSSYEESSPKVDFDASADKGDIIVLGQGLDERLQAMDAHTDEPLAARLSRSRSPSRRFDDDENTLLTPKASGDKDAAHDVDVAPDDAMPIKEQPRGEAFARVSALPNPIVRSIVRGRMST